LIEISAIPNEIQLKTPSSRMAAESSQRPKAVPSRPKKALPYAESRMAESPSRA
jgi:hypothetical protein